MGGKEFILDINIILNNDTHINLEMQVANEHNWTNRSLSYLCRSFDQLYRGQRYEKAVPVIHIGFLDFDLFPDNPEFYATYMMQNVKNHHLYSSKFKLSVVNYLWVWYRKNRRKCLAQNISSKRPCQSMT